METSANVFARFVLEQTQPEALKQAMSNANIAMYRSTKLAVKHEAKVPEKPVE